MSLSNQPPNSPPEGQSSKDWRNELKRRIEAHQQRKEDPQAELSQQQEAENQAFDPSQQEAAAGSSLHPRAPAFSEESLSDANSGGLPEQASLRPGAERPDLPRSADEPPPKERDAQAQPSAEPSSDAPDPSAARMESTDLSASEAYAVQPPFENGGHSQSDSASALIERPLDHLSEASPDSRQQIVTFSEKAPSSHPPLEKGLPFRVQNLPASPAAPASFSNQDEMLFEEGLPDDEAEAGEAGWGSREIFLSRLLAGLVDLLLSAFFGLIFGWAASALLGFDFFSPSTIEIGAATGLLFYWVSSLFFLLLSGQTPGMHLTGLQLLYQESAELPLMAVLIRVLAILPVIATVAGLLWGLFDPWGRCLHDRLSQTRVASLPDSPGKSPSAQMLG